MSRPRCCSSSRSRRPSTWTSCDCRGVDVFIPLVDSLRCIAGHEDTWLVASIERSEERDIRHGFLGCPICFAEYPIRDGIAYFGVDPAQATAAAMPARVGEDDAVR